MGPYTQLNLIGDLQEEPLGILPAKAGIGYGFAIDSLANFLTAFLNVALDHDTFDKLLDVGVEAP